MEEKLTLQEKIIKTQFDILKEHVGEKVVVEHYENGCFDIDRHIIRDVTDYYGISFNDMYMAFIGYDCAIKRILLNGKVLYEAIGLPEPYGYYDDYELIEVIRKVFGPTQADKELKILEESKKKEEERKLKEQEYASKYQKEVLPQILLQTKPLIKEEMYEKWVELCNKNSNSYIGISVIKRTSEVLVYVNNGMSFEEAMNKVSREHGSSGYGDSLVAATICKYAIIGDEFKRYWNGLYGQEDANGVINPSIIHIKR